MDELDRRLTTLAERLVDDDPVRREELERRVRRVVRRRRIQRGALVGMVAILVGGLALVAVQRNDHRKGARTSTVAPVPPGTVGATVVTKSALVQLVGGRTVRETPLSAGDTPGSSIFLRTTSGIVGIIGPYGSGAGASLVLIADSGTVTRMAQPASGFALSHDLRRIAWLEPHLSADGYIRSATLHEANFPTLDREVHTDINDQGSVVGYAGPVVLLNLGDGATGRGGLWNPSTNLVADPGTLGIFDFGTRDGLAMGGDSDPGCFSLYRIDPGDVVTPPSQGALVQSFDCHAGVVSADGSMTVFVGPPADLQPPVVIVDRVADGSQLATGPLPGPPPAYIVAWTDVDSFTMLLRASTGAPDWEVFVCDLHVACRSAGTVAAPAAHQGQVPVALVVDAVSDAPPPSTTPAGS